jgi:hypothetical protein
MTDVPPTIEDEIGLFGLGEMLWREKVIIGCFLAVALVAGGAYGSPINKKTYETVTAFEIINALAHSESDAKVVADLRKGFHSQVYLFPMVGNDAERQTPIEKMWCRLF